MADYRSNWPLIAPLEHRLHRHMDAIIGNATSRH